MPIGTLLAVRVTVELKVPTDWTPTLIAVLFPRMTDLNIGAEM